MSEWADKRMSAAERASDASIAELANEWAERVNERAEERMQMAQYSTRQFKIISTHSGMGRYTQISLGFVRKRQIRGIWIIRQKGK